MTKLAARIAWFVLCSCAWAEPVNKLDAVANQDWLLVSHDSKSAANAKTTLRITNGGKVSGRASVNSYGGQLTLNGQGGCQWGRPHCNKNGWGARTDGRRAKEFRGAS